MLFVVATYSQVVQNTPSSSANVAYGLFMSAAHWIWFSLVALFFSTEALRQHLLARQGVIDKMIGSALIGLGVMLVLPGVGR